MWLLIEGTLEVMSSLNEINMVEGYGAFGEREVLRSIKSEVGLRCRTDCCFLTIKRSNYHTALRKYRFIELKETQSFLQLVLSVSDSGPHNTDIR